VGGSGLTSVDEWASALADAALPRELNRGRQVIFAADAEAIERAARSLGVDPATAEAVLVKTCRQRWKITNHRGVTRVSDDAEAWLRAPNPRPAPPWLALLGVCTLAASWMDSNEEGRAHGYYRHLAKLLDVDEQPGSPPIPGFDVTKCLWSQLAGWMRDDEAGRRGLLRLPDPHTKGYRNRPYVMLPVSQVIFRRRDRVILGDFFAAHRAGFDAGWNMRRYLYGYRHQLTAPAREKIEDPEMAELVETALRSAYAAWDGSTRDEAGRKLWLAQLRLGASARRVTLNVGTPAELGAVTASDGDEVVELPAPPADRSVPLVWLDRIAATGVSLRVDGRDERLVIRRTDTLLFERGEVGMVGVAAAIGDQMWVLSHEQWAHDSALDEWRVRTDELPTGWTLLGDIPSSELPEHLAVRTTGDRPAVALAGGLELGPGVYLYGYSPRLVSGELAEPFPVRVNGRGRGVITANQARPLELGLGVSQIDVGDVASFDVEMAERGSREGVGSLAWRITSPVHARWGATQAQPSGKQTIHGALLRGVEPVRAEAPFLLRTRATVHVIRHDGTVTIHARPEPDGWMRLIGLTEGPARWRVHDAERAAFVVVTGTRPRVIQILPGTVTIDDPIADLTDRYPGAETVDRNGQPSEEAAAAWRELVSACEELYEPS
jgi:hypothetical protein